MGNKKYDPLIFGTVDIVEKKVTCPGHLFVVEYNNFTHRVFLACNTCNAILHTTQVDYYSRSYPIVCGATICQE